MSDPTRNLFAYLQMAVAAVLCIMIGVVVHGTLNDQGLREQNGLLVWTSVAVGAVMAAYLFSDAAYRLRHDNMFANSKSNYTPHVKGGLFHNKISDLKPDQYPSAKSHKL